MKVKGVHGLLSAIAVLLAIMAYLYFKDNRTLKEVQLENTRMAQKIEESALKQRDAIVQKRISKQLEEIAQQQKLITESQKTIALEQRGIAEQKQNEAIQQKQIADQAKTLAINALDDAEKQRKIAVNQKEAAEAAEKNATRLRMLALGQSLSARSINQKNTGNDSLATMLALTAWRFTLKNGGDLYQSELFRALKMSSAEETALSDHKGYIRDVAIKPGTGENSLLASVSQSGEVFLWEGDMSNLKSRMIMDVAENDFRHVLFSPSGSTLLAVTAGGDGVLFKSPFSASKYQKLSLSDTQVAALAFVDENTVALPEGSNIIGIDLRTGGSSITQLYNHSSDIQQLLFNAQSGKLFFSDVTGSVFSIAPNGSTKATRHCQFRTNDISCLSIDNEGRIAAGTTSGKIWVSDKGNIKELIGHLSQVNGLVSDKDLLLSVSYDRTVRLWNLNKPSLESIIIEEHGAWGYCIGIVPGAQKVVSAGADRLLRVTTIDPKRLAEFVSQRVPRDFTQEEWAAYVDPSVEYQSLKQDK